MYVDVVIKRGPCLLPMNQCWLLMYVYIVVEEHLSFVEVVIIKLVFSWQATLVRSFVSIHNWPCCAYRYCGWAWRPAVPAS